jgi:hypothetical protein
MLAIKHCAGLIANLFYFHTWGERRLKGDLHSPLDEQQLGLAAPALTFANAKPQILQAFFPQIPPIPGDSGFEDG